MTGLENRAGHIHGQVEHVGQLLFLDLQLGIIRCGLRFGRNAGIRFPDGYPLLHPRRKVDLLVELARRHGLELPEALEGR